MIQPMKAVSIALFVTVVLATPVAAHDCAIDMLKDAAVNHDLEQVTRRFKALVQKIETTARAQFEHGS